MMRVRLMRLWQPGAVVMAVNKAMVIHQCRVRVPFLPLPTLRFSQCKGSRLHSTGGGGGGKARPISLQTMVEEGEKMNHSSNPFGILIKEVEGELGSPLGSSPQASPSKPLIIVISGPSGVGKDAVIKKLQEIRKEIHFVVTATTRSMRPGEVEGKDYFFVSKEEFQSMIDNEELLEHAIVYGENKGIPKQQVRDCIAKGVDVVLRVDVQGAATVKSILGSSAVFIFLVAESEFALVQRLVERKTESMERLLVRVRTAREEMKRLDEFDYVVVNADGQLERSVSLISSIIDAEKSRVHQRTAHV